MLSNKVSDDFHSLFERECPKFHDSRILHCDRIKFHTKHDTLESLIISQWIFLSPLASNYKKMKFWSSMWTRNVTKCIHSQFVATPKKGWQFWRPHPRDFWYIGFEINEADVSIFVLICQQGCGWCGDHSFRASEGAMIIHNWRACVLCREGWQNWMILTFEKCKLSARLKHG